MASCSEEQSLSFRIRPRAIRVDYSHFRILNAQSRQNLGQRKRDLDDVLFMESVAVTTHTFEHFDIPVRSATRKRGHIDDQQVPLESVYPGWLGDVAFELTLCVDVKDEAARRR